MGKLGNGTSKMEAQGRGLVHLIWYEMLLKKSMLHEAKIAYYAFDAAILFATTIGPAVAKAT